MDIPKLKIFLSLNPEKLYKEGTMVSAPVAEQPLNFGGEIPLELMAIEKNEIFYD